MRQGNLSRQEFSRYLRKHEIKRDDHLYEIPEPVLGYIRRNTVEYTCPFCNQRQAIRMPDWCSSAMGVDTATACCHRRVIVRVAGVVVD
jgi:hypothetical protein